MLHTSELVEANASKLKQIAEGQRIPFIKRQEAGLPDVQDHPKPLGLSEANGFCSFAEVREGDAPDALSFNLGIQEPSPSKDKSRVLPLANVLELGSVLEVPLLMPSWLHLVVA